MSYYTDNPAIAMLTGASADEAKSSPVPLNNTAQHFHEMRMTQGTSAGVVKAGYIPTYDFTGEPDWFFEMDATDTSVAADLLAGPAVRQITYPGPGGFVVHQIKTALTGGTVTSTVRRTQYGT